MNGDCNSANGIIAQTVLRQSQEKTWPLRAAQIRRRARAQNCLAVANPAFTAAP